MDYAALKVEIQSGPLAAELAPLIKSGDDWSVASTLNRRDRPGVRKVPVRDLYLYLLKRMRWRGIVAAATDPQHPATDAAYTAQALATGPQVEVDTRDPVSIGLIDALVMSALITAPQGEEIKALSDVLVSRAEEIGLGHVSSADVAAARGSGA